MDKASTMMGPEAMCYKLQRIKFENFVTRVQLLGKPFINGERTLEREGEGYEDITVDLMWMAFKEGGE